MDWNSWELPPIFKLIQEVGNVADEEMREVFNLGIGLIEIVSQSDVKKVLETAAAIGENGIVIGEIA